MNLGEAVTHILRTRGQNLLRDFWKEDLSSVVGGVIADSVSLYRESRTGLLNFSLRKLPGTIGASARDLAFVVRHTPGRIKRGLGEFQKDFLGELEKKPDRTEKALFCLRVLGILASTSVSAAYQLNKGKALGTVKLRPRSVMAQFIVAELLARTLRLFVVRLLNEVEKEVTSASDLENVRYLRKILSEDGATPTELSDLAADDPAFRITEKLKKIILNGDDEA